jgi:uncharacterized membrane protein YbhN (UPF0104 family)
MSRQVRTGGSLIAAALILAILVWHLGTGPFLEGFRMVDARALAAAAALAAMTTVCCAWRWKTVARGLGVELSLPHAVAAYYRSVFLNVTVPGGIVGDVHRGVSHGRDVGDVGLALRAVAWDRAAGQAVQVALTVVVLLALPSPVQSAMPLVTIALAAAIFAVVLLMRAGPAGARSRAVRIRIALARDIRDGLLARRTWIGVALASALVVAGHAVTFMIAARTAGVAAPPSRMLPIALLVAVVTALPSMGIWGSREGAAAWLFSVAGLGARAGVTTGVVYAVMMLVASLPGAAVLVVAWFRRPRQAEPAEPPLTQSTAHA